MKITQLDNDAYEVVSDSGKTYTVRYEGSGDGDPEYCAMWSCDCPASTYRSGLCKHAHAVIDAIDNDELHDEETEPQPAPALGF